MAIDIIMEYFYKIKVPGRKICANKIAKHIRKIIDEEASENSAYNLIKDMLTFRRNDFEGILLLLKKLKEGLLMD